MKITVIPIVISTLGTVIKRFVQEIGELGNKRTSRDHQNNSIIKIGQNTEKSPGDLRKHAAAQTPSSHAGVKNSQKSKIL